MAKRTGKGKNASISEEEVTGVDRVLIEHGKTYPHVPGLVRSLVPLCPSAIRTVLKFNLRTTGTSTIGSLVTQIMSGNSCFDPDVTGVGGQPLGYDQWGAMYQRYRVLASSCSVMVATPDASTNDSQTLRLALVPSNISTAFTNFEAGASSPYAKDRYVNGCIPNGNSRLTSTMESAVIMGTTKGAILADDDSSALVSANPGNQWYWHILCSTMDSSANASLVFEITVSYLVDFYERWLLSLSATEREKLLRASKRASKGRV